MEGAQAQADALATLAKQQSGVLSMLLEAVVRHQRVVWVVAALLMTRWYRSLREELRLAHGKDKVHPVIQRWKSSSQVLKDGYRPPAWWSVGTEFLVGSLHTIFHQIARTVAPPLVVEYDRELLKLECGATVGLDWAKRVGDRFDAPCKHDSSKPIVFVHHGLTGCSKSQYVQSIVGHLVQREKFRVVVMVARGCGGLPLTTPYGFTAAGFDDMRQAAEHLRAENPDAKMFAVGYSLGAGLLANYLGRSGGDCVFSGACVVSPCWDFLKVTPYFEVWSRHFLAASLQDHSKDHLDVLKQNSKADLDKAMSATCVREYDYHAVISAHGFESVDHYYAESSPIAHAHKIVVPTLALSADDDPVCSVQGADDLSRRGIFGPGLLIARTRRGGHVSHAEGLFGTSSMLDRLVMEWFDACYEHEFDEAPELAKMVSKATGTSISST